VLRYGGMHRDRRLPLIAGQIQGATDPHVATS
jgi:hypothetical protein